MNESRFTRRMMLVRSAQAATCAAVVSQTTALFAAPASRGFKIGACDWSLGKSASIEALDVAKKIGLDGVQVNMGSVGEDMQLRKAEVQKAYLEATRRTGMEIASVALCELNNIPLKSDPRAAGWLLDSIDVCKALGVKVTMPACFAAGDLDMEKTEEIDHLVGVLKEAASKAEKAGVAIGLENYLSAEDNMKILDRVGSPALAVYYDVGNSTDKGRDVCKEIRLLGKRICEFHAKDANHRLGKGRIDFQAVRKAMDAIDYRGWIQLESSIPNGVVADYTTDCTFLRGIFPQKV